MDRHLGGVGLHDVEIAVHRQGKEVLHLLVDSVRAIKIAAKQIATEESHPLQLVAAEVHATAPDEVHRIKSAVVNRDVTLFPNEALLRVFGSDAMPYV